MKKSKLNMAADIFFPVALVIYSLLLVNQGITVTDTGYNYANFVNFHSLDNMWKFSTYYATALGYFFTRLPGGMTLLGLNIYTGLIKTAIALCIYYACVKGLKLRKDLTFFAELVALGFCWCPTALIYNYLTYLLFNLGAFLLLMAVRDEKPKYYVLAGVALGFNVLVRLPNLAEMALIFALWFCCIFKKIPFVDILKKTGLCIAGYAAGLLVGLLGIFIKHGPSAYFDGILRMISMPSDNGAYTVGSMVMNMYYNYRNNLKWLLLACCFVVLGTLFYLIVGKKIPMVKKILFTLASLSIIAIYYKCGVFNLSYYNYSSMYTIGIIFLMMSGAMALYVMFFGKEDHVFRMHAMIAGILIVVTPLGSNNVQYSSLNNLFLVMPFVLECIRRLFLFCRQAQKKPGRFSAEPLLIVLSVLTLFTAVQGVLFGACFVFRDGTNGEKRIAQVADNSVLVHMVTNEKNAAELSDLNAYLTAEGLKGSEALLYQDVPGLSFFMDLKPAISTVWPDLDSFSGEVFDQELSALEASGSKPPVITGKIEDETNPKVQRLRQYLQTLGYEQTYDKGYSVYR